jgi:hypothetical protein
MSRDKNPAPDSARPRKGPRLTVLCLVGWAWLIWAGIVARRPEAWLTLALQPPPGRLRRWIVASTVLAGTFHGVSAATQPSISSALDVQVQVGTPFSYRITINQAWVINSFDARPLPTGLSINKKLGIITGKPTQIGTHLVTLVASQDNLPDRTLTNVLTLRVISGVAPPLFTTNPADTVVLEGTDVVLSAEATGVGPIRYQWYHAFSFRGNISIGPKIPGATNATLAFPHVTAEDGGYYLVSAVNRAGTNYSQAAQLSLILEPQIFSQPESRTVHEGAPLYLYLSASGGAELNVQWRKNGTDVPGATNEFYNVPATLKSDAGRYDAVLTNAAGRLTSKVAVVTVVDPLVATLVRQPEHQLALAFNSIPGADYLLGDLVSFEGTNVFWNFFTIINATGPNSVFPIDSTNTVHLFRLSPY